VLPTSAVLCGDATALPFTAASFDGLLCVAALGLFDEPQRVLAEIRRVLKPGATLLFVTAERRWAQVMRWPAAVAERIAPLLPLRTASPDLTGDLEALLASAGLIELRSRAMLLEPGVSADLSELALLPAAQIAALFPALSQSDRDACAAALADIEIELCSVVLAVCAQNPANEAPQIRIPSSQLIHKLLLG
jgi:2-polyprenyl-3-methyl-5-hydroxy-6-metoxy-1,4-benzoquinol methylase